MTIITITSTLSHRYLMNKSKDELARWIMEDNARQTKLYQAILDYGHHKMGCQSVVNFPCSCGYATLEQHAKQWLEPGARGDVP